MRKLIKISLVSVLLMVLAILNVVPTAAQEISPNSLLATITGLQAGEQAILSLQTNPAPVDDTSVLAITVISKGETNISIDMTRNLKDGYYQLSLTAPDKYYRDPQAYHFMVSKSKVVNPHNSSISFKLVPPENQTLKPFRPGIDDIAAIAGAEGFTSPPDHAVAIIEPILSLSAPTKQPVSLGQTAGSFLAKPLGLVSPLHYGNTNRHYLQLVSTKTGQKGVEARSTVTDPGVVHDGTANEFLIDHVYATDSANAGGHWIETGWGEMSWQNNQQYMFVYWGDVNGNSPSPWPLYSVSNPLQFRVRLSSGTSWVAESLYYGWWTQHGDPVDLGFSQAAYEFNGLEMYSAAGTVPLHPSLPSTCTDAAYLYLNGSWVTWDSSMSSTTSQSILPSDQTEYYMAVYTDYYYFYLAST